MNFSDEKSVLNPEKTPLFIGQGVVVHGTIEHKGEKGDTAVILGELKGDIHWDGVVQVTQGGTISAAKKISCRELVVAGDIHGEGVVIEAGILRMEPTAVVQVEDVQLPPGGLEQSRGSFFTGRLTMSPNNPYNDTAANVGSAAAPARLQPISSGLPAAASFTTGFPTSSHRTDADTADQELSSAEHG